LNYSRGTVRLCVSALTFPTICRTPPSRIDLTQYVEFASLNLASGSSLDDKPIDTLIGSDLYWQFITGKIIRGTGDLVAIESKFGWILSGSVERSSGNVINESGNFVFNLIIEREDLRLQ
jgi:hypothetical protein